MNGTEVTKAAMAGKLACEHVQIVIKQDEAKLLNATEGVQGVNNNEVVKAAMAGKLNLEHVKIVIKQDDTKHLSATEFVQGVNSTEVVKNTALAGKLTVEHVKTVIKQDAAKAKDAAEVVTNRAHTKANAEPKERPDKAEPGMRTSDADHHPDTARTVPKDLVDAYKERHDKADPVMDPPDSLLTHE